MTLGVITTLIAVPIGTALALGLTRWRSRTSNAANAVSLFPLVTPELVLGSALYLVITTLYTQIGLGRNALILGHVTFSISFILVIVRGRLVSIGNEFETAAQDLGATRMQAIRTVLLPMLVPAIFASAMITFAASLDDFVVSNFLFGDASQITVPVLLYSAVKAAPSPALNALATLLLHGHPDGVAAHVRGPPPASQGRRRLCPRRPRRRRDVAARPARRTAGQAMPQSRHHGTAN